VPFQDKRVLWNYSEIQAQDNVTLQVHTLTERDVLLFSALSTAILWRSRWLGTYTDNQYDALQAEIADALDRLYMAIDFCSQVADCITNDTGTQQAIINQITTNQDFIDAIQNIGAASESGANADSLDKLYGAAFVLANWIDAGILDAADRVTEAASIGEAIAELFSGTVLFDVIPVDSVVAFIAEVADIGAAAIAAEQDASTTQALACYIFEILRCNENSNFNFNALKDNLNSLPISIIAGKPDYFAALVGFFALNAPHAFERIWRSGLNNPDSDWQLFCTACSGRWQLTWDFLASDGGWFTVNANTGVYASGVGWQLQQTSANNNNLLTIRKAFTIPAQIDTLIVLYDLSNIGPGNSSAARGILNGVDGANIVITPPPTGTDVEVTYNFVTAQDFDTILYYLANRAFAPSQGGSGVVKRITASGPGAPPS